MGVVVVPTGGCGSIKHWVTLDLINKLGKPFVIFQDSDKKGRDENSSTRDLLLNLGFVEGENFIITKKRELENYIPFQTLNNLCPGANLEYGDYDDVKDLCLRNNERDSLGKDKVLKEHFTKLNFDQIRSTFFDGNEDEFLNLYELTREKL